MQACPRHPYSCRVNRVIAHIDMDAFFVSVELLRNPSMRGKPVVVANGDGPGSRSVVMAASYEARRFGVHSALPLSIAIRRCPNLLRIPSQIGHYREVSRQVMSLLGAYTDLIEVAGLDEAYLDLSPSPTPKTRARALKAEVLSETGLVCSVGMGPNKLVAKIASDLDKPNGFCLLTQSSMLERVGDRPARLIPGVGPKTAERLATGGVNTVSDLAGAGDERLIEVLGRNGPSLGARARGEDERPLETDRRRKSESRETTFREDVADRGQLEATLEHLANAVGASLRAHALSGRTVTLKVKYPSFESKTRSHSLATPTADGALVAGVAKELLRRLDPAEPVRLIGVGVSGLTQTADGTTRGDDAAGRVLTLPI